MGKLILTLGEPGSGKSRAILNLDPAKTVVVQPNNKDLPFRGGAVKYSAEKKNLIKINNFENIKKVVEAVNKQMPQIQYLIVEDLTHYFSERVIRDAKIKGFEKWTDLAVDVFNSLIKIEGELRQDLWVIVIAHTTASTDIQGNQIITLQTPGKLLENIIKIPSYFTYVLHADPVVGENNKVEYRFLTNTDGVRIAKSPEGCLDLYEENDYAKIIAKIEQYQNAE